jgi:DNA-binding CsgD family transcriptional regulator
MDCTVPDPLYLILGTFDVVRRAAIAIGSDGRVVLQNRCATELMVEGLTVAGGRLGSTDPEADAALAALAALAGAGARRAMPGLALCAPIVVRRDDKPKLLILTVDVDAAAAAGAGALLLVHKLGPPPLDSVLALTPIIYDVSPAEMRAAEQKLLGATAQEAGDALGRARTTVRNQSSSVYRKVGVDGHERLIAVLLPLASLPLPPELPSDGPA